MVQYIPPPNPRSLLPPLLACLPTAFVSPRPPPALIPLLSPVLQQRVQLLASSSSPSSSSSESWLPLLCWDQVLASRLVEFVSESHAFEIHPTSGEIEIGLLEPITYRRLDEETLQARIVAVDVKLDVVALYCTGDQEADNHWRIAEVRPIDDSLGQREQWYHSMAEAEERANEKAFVEATRDNGKPEPASNTTDLSAADEDDYWAQYDKTPGRTPAHGHSPAPGTNSNPIRHGRTASEAEYFERYAGVQPEMDGDDPSQEHDEQSTLNGNVLGASPGNPLNEISQGGLMEESANDPIHQPIASSIPRLERLAADQQEGPMKAVREHIVATMKSLCQLSLAHGIERTELEYLVMTQIQESDYSN